MDSMRSLNKSLPTSTPKKRPGQPPDEVLQAFKTAALSVTNLYKQAASSQATARSQGYQDALDDLLLFLDKENLGLGDGEGWRVRQWATERLDGPPPGHGNSESEEDREEEKVEVNQRSLSPSPGVTQATSSVTQPTNATSETPSMPSTRSESAPPSNTTSSSSILSMVPKSDTFVFRSAIAYPQDADMQSLEMTQQPETSNTSSSTITSTPKASRVRNMHGYRHGSRLATNRALGAGAGSKRKVPLESYFNLDSLGWDSKDGMGGSGKRNRLA